VTFLYPQKLALTSLTGGGLSVGIVRSRTKAMEFSLVLDFTYVPKDEVWPENQKHKQQYEISRETEYREFRHKHYRTTTTQKKLFHCIY
jgi:hypothetical protein